MNVLKFIGKKILVPTCVFFTLIWLIVCVLIDSVSDVVNINLASSVMCFMISLALSFCNLILDRERIPFVGRYFLHMVFSVISISGITAFFSGVFQTRYPLTTRSFYLVLLLIAAYLVLATPALLLYRRISLSSRKKEEEYRKIFSGKK